MILKRKKVKDTVEEDEKLEKDRKLKARCAKGRRLHE